MTETHRYFVTGGAGFIGAHLTTRLLGETSGHVTVYDNFSTGQGWHLEAVQNDPRLTIVEGDVRDCEALRQAIRNHHTVFHLASNSDIARAAVDPDIDFSNGTMLTRNVLEAMRLENVKRIFFTSGSGVYGEVPPYPIPEDYDKMIPVSTYGACKLACEALVSAYSFMFDIQGVVFRFANVVGPRQTHGVAYDFIRRLAANPARLKIFGDGTQSKPYIHVDDVVGAFLMLEKNPEPGYRYFNVASKDFLTVNEIADLVAGCMGLKNVEYAHTGGSRGWKADVPLYRLDTRKIRALGWKNKMNSREAVRASITSMVKDVAAGRIKPDYGS
ncbi:MAG TPA: NAD-dependent epimerase/dehydratase family protein [Kiritimatiellia bacterium]|nr:NAD-dependent epimerase/dehydratase family protein [Kiritimatiellia bacterium]